MTTQSIHDDKRSQGVASAIQRAFAVVWICPALHRVDEGAFPSTGTEPPCCQIFACSFASCRALFALRFRAVPRHPPMTEIFLRPNFREAELTLNVVCGVAMWGSHGIVAPEIVDIKKNTVRA
jgi:hypothetical protein